MTMQTRLQRVTRSLSPLQRITLILQARNEGRAPDPELGRVEDPQQAKAFRRYLALLFATNSALGPRCDAVVIISADLEAAAEQVRLLTRAAGALEEEHGLKPPRRLRDWRRPGEMQVNEFLRSLAREQREDLLSVLALRWQELRAVELVWDELAAEFGGADPVEPQFREKVAEAAGRMRALAREMDGTHRLVESDETIVMQARQAVDDAFQALEPLL
jgi:hypothetical protein